MMASDIEDLMRRNRALEARLQAVEAHILADERRIGELSKRLEGALERLEEQKTEVARLKQYLEVASIRERFAG